MISVIFGSAESVFDDWRRLEPMLTGLERNTLAVNFAVLLPVHFDYVVSLHHEYIKTYEACALMRANEYRYRKSIYTVAPENATYNYKSSYKGTSGRYAVDFARSIGASKIILCGIPIDGSKRFYGDVIHSYAGQIKEDEWQGQDKNSLRSMSGNTKKLFGEPTQEWINKGEVR